MTALLVPGTPLAQMVAESYFANQAWFVSASEDVLDKKNIHLQSKEVRRSSSLAKLMTRMALPQTSIGIVEALSDVRKSRFCVVVTLRFTANGSHERLQTFAERSQQDLANAPSFDLTLPS